jgi:hypothetical protein
VLWNVEGMLERTLVEPFAENHEELLADLGGGYDITGTSRVGEPVS